MDDLLTLYREFRLPLPPADAPLVLTPTGWFRQLAPGRSVPILTLGFLLQPARGESPAVVLVGPLLLSRELPREAGTPVAVNPEEVVVEDLSFDAKISTFPLDTALATAVQCHARGYGRLAQTLYARGLQVRGHLGPGAVRGASRDAPWMRHRRPVGYTGTPGDDARTVLAGTAWTYWMNELLRSESDWNSVATMMEHILASAPVLRDGGCEALLRSLRAASVPTGAEFGSVEADVDNLIHCTQAGHGLGGEGKPEPRYQKLLLRGFEAVPALIEHLEDDRLTRGRIVGFNNFPTMPRRVGEIVADLLQAIAGEQFSRDWIQRQLGVSLDRAAAMKWWAEASATGEKAYVRAHVLPSDPEAQEPHGPHLAIIAARYTRLLPELYAEVLDARSRMQSWSLVEELVAAPLPCETKLALFGRGAAHPSLAQRRPAIHGLRRLGAAAAADAALLVILENLPTRAAGRVWSSEESGVTHLVMESTAPSVWAALLVATKRAHVSLRLELLNPMTYSYLGDRHRGERLNFLGQFLDDDAGRDVSEEAELYDGPCAAFTFPRITVRDFAAMQMAHLLALPDDPQPRWSAKRWATLRAKVKRANAHGSRSALLGDTD